MNSDNALNIITNEFENVANIRKGLFSVVDIQVPKPPIKGIEEDKIDEPDTKLVYNSNGKFLGHVGQTYESIQPVMFLDSVIGTLEGCEGNFDLSGLTYKSLAKDKIVKFRLPLGEIKLINKRGKEDLSKVMLDFTTGFGGKQKTTMSLYFWAQVCSNGMMGWATELELSLKHTVKNNMKVLLYCAEVMKTVGRVKETETIWNEMNRKEVDSETAKKFAEVIAGVTKEEKQTGKLSTRKANILQQVNESIAIEFERRGTTVWGLLQGATNYTNHVASGSENEDYILVPSATGAKINELAQREAIALLN